MELLRYALHINSEKLKVNRFLFGLNVSIHEKVRILMPQTLHDVVQKDDIPKTTLKTSFGHYEFIFLPFGLTNALGLFMSLINRVFHEYLDTFIQVFIDNILIYSQTMEEHEEHLCLVL
jgi:hypothetical protein